jgi:recombination protein RecT
VIDRTLKKAEEERLRKNATNRDAKYNNDLPYDWNNVNLTDLALDAVHYARMGMDMQEKNHLFPIPYGNKKTQKYDITFMLGYSGIQYIAERYATVPPKSVSVELVYSKDTFKPIKKSKANPVESYEFEITSPFDRGEIIGGFGYIEYDDPAKNTLVLMSIKDILKRKPKYASANFWGGTATVWESGKKIETEVEGWFDEMCLKTVVREVYSSKHIPRDPSKIDDSYQYMREREVVYTEYEVQQDALENANQTAIQAPTVPNTPQIYEHTSEQQSVGQGSCQMTIDGGVGADPEF